MDPEIEELLSLFRRDLGELRREILAVEQGERLFQTPAGIQNSLGTLGLHLAGNLQHHIGATLGETGYVRDRPAEFSRRCSAAEIMADNMMARDVGIGIDAFIAKKKPHWTNS